MGISSALGSSALLPAGLGFRNMLINGDMRIAQRGTSTASITTANYYTTDRWYLNLSSAGTWTMAQTTDAPTSEGFGYSTKLTCTTAQATPATTNNARFWQKLEGFNVAGLAKGTSNPKPVVLSFWVKSGLTGTFICTLDDLDNSRKISQAYTINVANTWEKKTLYFNGDTTGAFVIDNTESLMVTWWLVAGPSFQGSSLSTSWSSASTLTDYANGQTNVAAGNNAAVNYWQVTGVQLEQNYQPTPFEQRPYGVELALCQRYYERYTPENTGTYVTGPIGANGYYSTTNSYPTVHFKVTKCKSEPSVAISAASDFTVYTTGVGLTPSSIAIDNITSYAVSLRVVTAAATSGAFATTYINNSSTAYLAIDSEL